MTAQIGAHPARTRREFSGTVDLEGGGSEIPTLGGGSRDRGSTATAAGDMHRKDTSP
jgi:hypothetical protein